MRRNSFKGLFVASTFLGTALAGASMAQERQPHDPSRKDHPHHRRLLGHRVGDHQARMLPSDAARWIFGVTLPVGGRIHALYA